MTEDGGQSPGQWARLRRWLLSWPGIRTIVASVLAAAAIILFVTIVLPTWDDCAAGVDRTGPDDQCIGLSDEYAFHPRFTRVIELIRAENDDVGRRAQELAPPIGPEGVRDRVVTLVYVLPVPVAADADLAAVQQHELEGAYVAQRNANSGSGYGGDRPLIQIVVANAGENGAHADTVVDRIRAYPEAERLTAVLGFDLSLTSIEDAVGSLGRQSEECPPDAAACGAFPVITSLITADGFAGLSTEERPSHVVRIVPTNADQARAAAAALADRGAYRTVVVQDTNLDDAYAATLGQQFTDAAAATGATLLRPEEYDSTDIARVPRRMVSIAEQLCDTRPDVVYFAGRASHLQYLADAVSAPESGCGEAFIEVWTGDDAVNLSGPLPANLTVTATALAHPGVWNTENAAALFSPRGLGCTEPPAGPEGSVCFGPVFGYSDGGAAELVDGGAIIGHDVVLTAVLAIRSAGSPELVGRSDVISVGFPELHGTGSIGGASGWISVCNDGDPERKAVPIIEIRSGAPATARSSPVAAAGGEPYVVGSPEQC